MYHCFGFKSEPRSIFAVPRSTFTVPRSTFAGPRSAFAVPRSTLTTSTYDLFGTSWCCLHLGSYDSDAPTKIIGSSYKAGFPLINLCVRLAGELQIGQIAFNFVTVSLKLINSGIAPNGSPRKSVSSPAMITRIPR